MNFYKITFYQLEAKEVLGLLCLDNSPSEILYTSCTESLLEILKGAINQIVFKKLKFQSTVAPKGSETSKTF